MNAAMKTTMVCNRGQEQVCGINTRGNLTQMMQFIKCAFGVPRRQRTVYSFIKQAMGSSSLALNSHLTMTTFELVSLPDPAQRIVAVVFFFVARENARIWTTQRHTPLGRAPGRSNAAGAFSSLYHTNPKPLVSFGSLDHLDRESNRGEEF